ncbi:1-acyl-sn-glycerol-3-phosphate acyltransferase [Labilithrix luteola]|uniref:1-acyl-sn-glycerol-3-phosphate acyltransferase n=2 Tax=Labilithrix luteola TaxID=1391654 RepID=A0A0K1QAZ9_9BACT|nr:1-acyl-sn-glycerol-3-phosphate acyltransferase [Labilithrix luteola]
MRASGFALVTASMLPAFLARMSVTPAEERPSVRDRWVKRWANALLALFDIHVVVDGALPPPPRGRGRLIVANHRSAIDIGVLLSTFGGTMVSRADIAGWPVIGAAARAAGTVFVDRSNAKSGAATLRSITKHLEDGMTIALFPEGTTFDGDEVRTFHGGAFVAAARAGAEILPVGLAYPRTSGAAFVGESFPEHLARMARSDSTRMVLAVGAPFTPTKDTRAAAITGRAHDEVSTLVSRARTRCGP